MALNREIYDNLTWGLELEMTGNSSPDSYKVEFVSPPLLAKDIEMYQEIVRKLRKAGFFESESCGVHIHVGVKDLPPMALLRK